MSQEDIAKLTAPLVLDPSLFALEAKNATLVGDGPMVEGSKDTADIGYRSNAQATAGWNACQVMTLDGMLILTVGAHVILLKTLTLPNGHVMNLRRTTLSPAAALQPIKYGIIA